MDRRTEKGNRNFDRNTTRPRKNRSFGSKNSAIYHVDFSEEMGYNA